MVQIPEKTLTLAEFLNQSETKPASEYIGNMLTNITKAVGLKQEGR